MESYLYRYISFEAFVGMVQSQSLAFVLPETWDDPKESAPFNYLLEHTDSILTKIVLAALHNKTYGQCWTELSESDAMWRIYSFNNRAVQIKSSEDKLKQLPNVRVVPVEYSDEKEFDYLNGVESFVNSLAIKRCAFSHEKEVRLIRHYIFSDENDVLRHIKAYLATNKHPQALEIVDSMYPGASLEEKVENLAQLLNAGNAKRTSIDVSFDNIPDFIAGVKVHPLAPEWYVGVVEEYCRRNNVPFDGKSTLYQKE